MNVEVWIWKHNKTSIIVELQQSALNKVNIIYLIESATNKHKQ